MFDPRTTANRRQTLRLGRGCRLVRDGGGLRARARRQLHDAELLLYRYRVCAPRARARVCVMFIIGIHIPVGRESVII